MCIRDRGIDIDKKKIVLPDVIKSVGVYDVTVKPYAEISAKIKVKVDTRKCESDILNARISLITNDPDRPASNIRVVGELLK